MHLEVLQNTHLGKSISVVCQMELDRSYLRVQQMVIQGIFTQRAKVRTKFRNQAIWRATCALQSSRSSTMMAKSTV